MAVEGIPPGGFRTVNQITGTNDLMVRAGQSGLDVATELLSSHMSGAPVIDEDDKLIGFISEFDILRALRHGKDLARTTAQEIMANCSIVIEETTSLEDAVKAMEDFHLMVLPVVNNNGRIAYSITRHDLLRAWIGLGPGVEEHA
jgi:CBS domain-containing protein